MAISTVYRKSGQSAKLISSFDDVCIVALFITPQIGLISLGSGTVRIDDFVLAIVIARHFGKTRSLPKWLRGSIALVLIACTLSLTFGVVSGRVGGATGVLYTLRPFEYMAGLLLGVSIVQQGHVRQLQRQLVLVVVTLAGLSILQVAGLEVGVSRASYDRAAGNLDGPYELAAVSGVLLFAFLGWRRNWVALMCLIPLTLSASRVTIVGVVILAVVSARHSIPHKAKIFAMVGAAVSVLLIPLSSTLPSGDSSIIARLSSTQPFAALKAGCTYADAVGTISNQDDYLTAGYVLLLQPETLSGNDISSQIRFARWCLLIKGLQAPQTIVFGYGPSFAGAAVDGQYIRYVVEQGILGLVAWLVLWSQCFRRCGTNVRLVVGIILINGIFIDIFASSRPMVLFWILIGVAVTTAPGNVGPQAASTETERRWSSA